MSTRLSDAVFYFKIQKIILSSVGRSRHGRGGDGRSGGRRTVHRTATDGRLICEYVGQTGDYWLGCERERLVAILDGMHHFEYELGLPEHLQVVYALLQNLRHRLFPPRFV